MGAGVQPRQSQAHTVFDDWRATEAMRDLKALQVSMQEVEQKEQAQGPGQQQVPQEELAAAQRSEPQAAALLSEAQALDEDQTLASLLRARQQHQPTRGSAVLPPPLRASRTSRQASSSAAPSLRGPA